MPVGERVDWIMRQRSMMEKEWLEPLYHKEGILSQKTRRPSATACGYASDIRRALSQQRLHIDCLRPEYGVFASDVQKRGCLDVAMPSREDRKDRKWFRGVHRTVTRSYRGGKKKERQWRSRVKNEGRGHAGAHAETKKEWIARGKRKSSSKQHKKKRARKRRENARDGSRRP